MDNERKQTNFWRDVVGVAKDVHAQMKAEQAAEAAAKAEEARRRAAVRHGAEMVIDGLWPPEKQIPPAVAQEVRRIRTVEREQELQQAYQQGLQVGYQRGLIEGQRQGERVPDARQTEVEKMHAENVRREYYENTSWLDRAIDRRNWK